jgi:NAD(P)-dependent dehydrogenase (short-subunit alcohol dehydrogenase family)
MRVLVVGGTGGFGSTICRLLMGDGHDVVAANRRPPSDDAPKDLGHVVLDQRTITAADLDPYDLVVDAAGPFQDLGQSLMEAAIVAGVHYVDIADDRLFVDAASLLDVRARTAGVCVVSGASSIPALSSAAALEIAGGMDRVDRVDVSISAGADAVFGPAVLHAMLSSAGRPIRWKGERSPAAMSSPRSVSVTDPGDGKEVRRDVLACDSPDLSTMPGLLPGGPQVRFRAGSELAVHNAAMRLVSWCVRRRIVRSGTRFRRMASVARRFTASKGSGRSFMLVEAIGHVGGEHRRCTWSILAVNGLGPTIPCLAVPAIVEAIDAGRIGTGARSASGLLSTSEILSRLPERDHHVTTSSMRIEPLYEGIIGSDWSRMPKAVRLMHDRVADGAATGTADVSRGSGILVTAICRIIGFPNAGHAVPVKVAFTVEDGTETWTRDFGGARFVSRLTRSKGLIEERFGPLRFRFRLDADEKGLAMLPTDWRLWHMPLPRFLMPTGVATEKDVDGRFGFDVPITLPIIGRVVHYVGTLDRKRTDAEAS